MTKRSRRLALATEERDARRNAVVPNSDGFLKCDLCGCPYKPREAHECTIADLKEYAVKRNQLVNSAIEVVSSEFMFARDEWIFTLADDVRVEVKFKGDIRPAHVKAFAEIFQAAADRYGVTEWHED
jgi:hypothetical protein